MSFGWLSRGFWLSRVGFLQTQNTSQILAALRDEILSTFWLALETTPQLSVAEFRDKNMVHYWLALDTKHQVPFGYLLKQNASYLSTGFQRNKTLATIWLALKANTRYLLTVWLLKRHRIPQILTGFNLETQQGIRFVGCRNKTLARFCLGVETGFKDRTLTIVILV